MSERKGFLLRMNPKLHRVLEQWAAAELRSVNSQIEFLLTEAAQKAGRWPENEESKAPPARSKP